MKRVLKFVLFAAAAALILTAIFVIEFPGVVAWHIRDLWRLAGED